MTSGIPPIILATIGILYSVLVVATFFLMVVRAFKPDKDFSEVSKRIWSWWAIVTIFSLAVVMERTVSIVFLGFVSFLAFKEFISMVPTRKADRRILVWGYLAIPLQFFWVHEYWYGMFIIFIPVWVFLFLPFRVLLTGVTDGFLNSVGTLHWGLMITVFSLSHAAYLLSLPAFDNPQSGSAGLLLFLVILTQFNDVAQYIWGKSFGGRKIVPSVSPGKTWAGFVGGVVSTMALSWMVAPYLTAITGWHAPAVGAVIAVSGFIGDVTMSALKRDMGVKDSSSFIPGHGGILDRVDSLTFTAPVFFHYVFFFFYGPRMVSLVG